MPTYAIIKSGVILGKKTTGLRLTHGVLGTRPAGDARMVPYVCAFCSSEKACLSNPDARGWRRQGYTTEIIELTIIGDEKGVYNGGERAGKRMPHLSKGKRGFRLGCESCNTDDGI